MLLIKMLQEVFFVVVNVSSIFFQIDFIEDIKGSMFHSNYVQLFSTLQELRMMSVMKALLDDLGHWVKPHGTTWFSKFLLT